MRSLLVVVALGQVVSAAAPTLRLPDGARPVGYAAELTVDPRQEKFTGVIDIDVDIARPLDVLWLNATGLTLTKATAGKTALKVIPGGEDFVGLAFPKPSAVGATRVHIEYSGPLSSKDSSAASRQKEGDDWYVFTHFEPIDARRVFPCFDEPSYKTPWRLTMRVRAGDRAFTNTAQTSEAPAKDGWKVVSFAESKPLPSYLVAWAVGPFEVVDAGKSARSGTPVRIITPRHQADRAAWAAQSSHQSLERLEAYFGSDYPYGKLDLIAVPLFGGAMENPGLVTFSSALILQKPAEESISRRRSYAGVATHELAHQWFGDLVTMAWWDDLWLNEAFASWMTPKIIETWQPSWGAAEQRVNTRGAAMWADSLISARQIRQPITSNSDMKNAFDGITYEKGATVIGMFERFVGAEVFQRGVARYTKKFAHGNATTNDFLAAISAEAGRDIAPAFSTFLDQPGVPIVSFELVCDKAPHLHMRQQRYLPAGSPGGGEGQLWQIPICVRWADGRACSLLSTREGDLELKGAKHCPLWVHPNDGGTAYYRAQPSAAMLAALEDAALASLSAPEKMALISDLNALVRAGRVELSSALKLAPRLAGDQSRFVVQNTANSVSWLRDDGLISAAQKPAFARYIRDLFGARAHQLGWTSKPTDDEDARLLRASLLPLVADEGEDPALVAEAQKLAAAWLADRHAVEADIIDSVLEIAAANGDQALFDRWLAAARAEKDRSQRRRLIRGLAAFRDPKIVTQSLAIVLSDSFDAREIVQLFWGASQHPTTRRLAWQWLQTNFDALVARLPRDGGSHLPQAAVSLCDDAVVPEVKAFFTDRAKKFEGGPRLLDEALEELHLCSVFRAAQSPSVARFFKK